MMSLRKSHPLFKIANNTLVDMPLPANITMFWNFGSLLGLCLASQLLTGLFLSMHYTTDINYAFDSVTHICRDVNSGWLLRVMHANGASFFFICMYLHIGRGIFYYSWMILHGWMVGVMLLLLTMATAFLGYVLPWGQMSLWGATVITNLFSAIPYIGTDLVQWLWGGFSVEKATLVRFFTLHFALPFVISAVTIVHILFLHQAGASNPLGLNSNLEKIPFHPYFTYKDIVGFVIMMTMLIILSLSAPYMLSDPDNFTPANPLVTPTHIQPEWYFLFAYAILRSIPNKLGGVISLFLSILILAIVPFSMKPMFKSLNFYPMIQILFWALISIIFLLTWIGARSVEHPYILTGQILTIMYFSYFLITPLMTLLWDYFFKS